MTDPETSREINVRTSSIVRIAYHQLSVMCGTHDPTKPTSVVATSVVATDADANVRDTMWTRRLFACVSSALRNAYTVTKDSHESVAAILGRAEDGMRAIDNAVCVGLDLVKERMSSINLPPDQIASIKDSVRNMFMSALEMFRLLFGGIKNRIEDSSVARETAQEETRKVSS